MNVRSTTRPLGIAAACAILAACSGAPPVIEADEQRVSGTAAAARPSRPPATLAPTPTPTATPERGTPAPAVPTAAPPSLERGRVNAAFETRGLNRSHAREVVCYPTDRGDAVIAARFVLADASDGSAALPTRFGFELDMAQLAPDTSYTLAYRTAGGGSAALETRQFTIPTASHAEMTDPPAGYTSHALTLNEAGLTVDGEFAAATTWRHALVYDKNKKLVVTAHAVLAAKADKFVISPVPGIDAGASATVYIHGDGRILFKKTLVRTAPVGQ